VAGLAGDDLRSTSLHRITAVRRVRIPVVTVECISQHTTVGAPTVHAIGERFTALHAIADVLIVTALVGIAGGQALTAVLLTGVAALLTVAAAVTTYPDAATALFSHHGAVDPPPTRQAGGAVHTVLVPGVVAAIGVHLADVHLAVASLTPLGSPGLRLAAVSDALAAVPRTGETVLGAGPLVLADAVTAGRTPRVAVLQALVYPVLFSLVAETITTQHWIRTVPGVPRRVRAVQGGRTDAVPKGLGPGGAET